MEDGLAEELPELPPLPPLFPLLPLLPLPVVGWVAAAVVVVLNPEETGTSAAVEDVGTAATEVAEDLAEVVVSSELFEGGDWVDPPKLEPAVVDELAAVLTFLTVTTLPELLVTRTSTFSVPKPLGFSKKL